jgi:tetratricopeptide (TPR) repeat protein/GTPase SAR1 family protein
MTHSDRSAKFYQKNQRALKTLARSIQLSQGEFSLILVRCNYTNLQQRIGQSLRNFFEKPEIAQESLLEISLPPSVKTLYSTIINTLKTTQTPPNAIMVFGLDSVVAIDKLFQSSNQVRDEFRKNCPCPLVLWVTEKLLQKLIRLAPDFKSWAATSIKFEATSDELIQLWRDQEEELFARVLDGSSNLERWAIASDSVIHDLPLLPPLVTVENTHDQLESAIQDLRHQNIQLDLDLMATQHFVMGRYDHALSMIDSALVHYQETKRFWQAQIATLSSSNPMADPRNRQYQEKLGVVLLYIGLCYWFQAESDQSTGYLTYWEAARSPFQECLHIFEVIGRKDLVAKFIPLLGEVLRRLQVWDELAVFAEKSLMLHQMIGNPVQLAQDYGFLAEVATEKKQWQKSQNYAQQALTTVACSPVPMRQHQGLYLLLLARALNNLGQSLEAMNQLKLALSVITPENDPRLYIRILKELRSLYYHHKEYQQAFLLKKQQRDIEHHYRFRPFIGASQLPSESLVATGKSGLDNISKAPRISALGRQKDIDNLLARIARPDQKMLVIYGESGVGKSSLINAGLVPALQQQPIGDRLAFPVVLRTYTDWAGTLANQLNLNLSRSNKTFIPLTPPFLRGAAIGGSEHRSNATVTSDWILDTLRQNADRNLLTILIFDQFEEFFFVVKQAEERQIFYRFLKNCLDIPFAKVIFSLRQDCLHYLLDIELLAKLEIINEDILNKNLRYYLNDFSEKDAKEVIKYLTKESNLYLEHKLINALVNDLSNDQKRVRPIELQLLCNQLQEDEQDHKRITTLAQYQALGSNPKQILLEHFLHQSIKDCGQENQDAAWKVLYQLTDSQGTRPLKTKDGLAAFVGEHTSNLEVILDILVQSGLVVLHREAQVDRYQLIHDYLVQHVREEYDHKFGLKVELKKLKVS